MSRIFWDTNLFIYLFEDYGPLSKTTAALRTKMLARGDQLLTSTLTLGEILVKPTEHGDMQLCSRYETAGYSRRINSSLRYKSGANLRFAELGPCSSPIRCHAACLRRRYWH